MSKYIDAEKIPWTDLNDGRGGVNVYVTFLEKVARMPAADVQEVRHGLWETEVRTIYGHKIPFFVCSVCGKSAADEYNYCPNCGASMRSIDDEVADLPMEAYYNKDWKMDEVEE